MDERIFVTAEQAKRLFDKKQKRTHTIKQLGNIMMGCDRDIKDLLKTIRKNKAEIGGEMCKKMSHGLVVWDRQEIIFVEVDNIKLEKLEKRMQTST